MSISTILNIKPILVLSDGGIISTGIVRGRQEQLRALGAALKGYKGKVIVQHFLAGQTAEMLAKWIAERGHEVEVRTVGPVLGVHLGIGSLGVAWVEPEQK